MSRSASSPTLFSGKTSDPPSDPGDALQQLLDAADELVVTVAGAYAAWLERYPPPLLLDEWNAEWRRYQAEQGRRSHWASLEFDLGWNYRPNPEVIHHQIRELFREAGNQIPQNPRWDTIRPIVAWRAIQRPAQEALERLRALRLAALPIVGAFPSRPDTEIQEHFDWLVGQCQNLARFAPLDFSSIRELSPGALRTETDEAQDRLRLLSGRVPHAGHPLRDLLAMYRGKCRPFLPATVPSDSIPARPTPLPSHDDSGPAGRGRMPSPESTDRPIPEGATMSPIPSPDVSAHPDLKAARDAVDEILKCLGEHLHPAHSALTGNPDPANQVSFVMGHLALLAQQLPALIAHADARIEPVRVELQDAHGKIPCVHENVVERAGAVLGGVEGVVAAGTNVNAPGLQKYLAVQRFEFERMGFQLDPRFEAVRYSRLDDEVRQAALRRARKPRDSSPSWAPGRPGVHRLIQIGDVCTLALHRWAEMYRLPGGPGQPARGCDERGEEQCVIWESLFPRPDCDPESVPRTLVHEAVADLARICHPVSSANLDSVQKAGEWVRRWGRTFRMNHAGVPGVETQAYRAELAFQEQALPREWWPIRKSLVDALALLGRPLPPDVLDRWERLCQPWRSRSESRVTYETLLDWLREAGPGRSTGGGAAPVILKAAKPERPEPESKVSAGDTGSLTSLVDELHASLEALRGDSNGREGWEAAAPPCWELKVGRLWEQARSIAHPHGSAIPHPPNKPVTLGDVRVALQILLDWVQGELTGEPNREAGKRPAIPLPTDSKPPLARGSSPNQAAPIGTSGNESGGEFDRLRAEAARLRLKGNEAMIIEMLCREHGRVPLADLAVACGWQAPIDSSWNSARIRLNKKLKAAGWHLRRHDNKAEVAPTKRSARK